MKRSSPSEDSTSNEAEDVPAHSSTVDHNKRPRLVQFEPIRISNVTSTTQQDDATRRYAVRKIVERLKGKQRVETELRERIKQAEKRQNVDDSMMLIMNRYWNQLNEDVRVLLQRFDCETSLDDARHQDETELPENFVTMLASGDDAELEKRCSQRVEFTLRAVRKLVNVFDGHAERNVVVTKLLNAAMGKGEAENTDVGKVCEEINAHLSERNTRLQADNDKLQRQLSGMQADAQRMKLAAATYDDSVQLAENRADEAKNLLDNARWELEKMAVEMETLDQRFSVEANERVKLDAKLAAVQLKSDSQSSTVDDNDCSSLANVTKSRLEQLEAELGDQRDLADTRLGEINDNTDRFVALEARLSILKTQVLIIPREVVEASAEYKSIELAFNQLLGDAERNRRKCELAHEQIEAMRAAHDEQIDRITGDERLAQHELQQEVMAQDEQLGQVRREYEMLRLEFEQTLANNEQSGPLTKEVRQQYVSLVKENQQHKQEAARFKRKWRDGVSTITRLTKELETCRRVRDSSLLVALDVSVGDKETQQGDTSYIQLLAANDGHTLEQLHAKLGTALEHLKRLHAQLSHSPSVETTVTALEAEVKKWHAMDDETKARHHNDELARRCQQLEEANERHRKEGISAKDEEETLMQEMESTGQAFEEMQEQNQRLITQLKEKDDANFKLMTERIRSNQSQKKLLQEQEMQKLTVGALQTQTEAANQAVKHQEEVATLMRQQHDMLRKELNLRNLSNETGRRRVAELSTTSADLKLQLEKTNTQLNDAQKCIHDKTHSHETLQNQLRRQQEEMEAIRRRLERAKKFEKVDRVDEVYLEEIRELKTTLTCASCNRNRKDTMLAQCAHTFCLECLKKRYDARRRKCPHCSLPFGLNDFKRFYL